MNRFIVSCLLASFGAAAAFLGNPLAAQEQETPYWATLRANEVYMRVGPSVDYRIEWVYRREGLPVRVVRVMEGWLLVQDPDGAQGWISRRLLSRTRGALVIGDTLAPLYERPDPTSKLRWNLEPGVVGRLGDCRQGWCELDVSGRMGFIEAARIWGDGET
ncbi:SH3 domain-containing protein [Altererythrobacter sp. GH1-8]|uniref:SH3 domain-containing protein n=1 Tax=Altererythrobacter sp. GH1-8 TaxID=3349333 RepID=UPI00374CF214